MSVFDPELINCCRVCRSPNQDGDYQCLFGTTSEQEGDHTNLSESGFLYVKLLDISLSETNYCPRFLCNSCHLQMKLFMKLKDKALKTLEYFQNVYNELVANTTDAKEKESINYDYQSNELRISSSEAQDCGDLLEIYPLSESQDYKEFLPNELAEEFDKTTAPVESTNYSYAAGDVEHKLSENNSYNGVQMEQNRLYTERPITDSVNVNAETALEATNIETDSYNEVHLEQNCLYTERQIADSIAVNVATALKEDTTTETGSLEKIFFPEFEAAGKTIQAENSEEHFPNLKLESILDKNDYVTEIYELIDDECDVEETYLENQELIEDTDYNSQLEINTETSSTYNDVEYLLEEETDDLVDEANRVEIKNSVKKRRLNKENKRSRTYKCLVCQLEFENIQEYKLHSFESHNEGFNCSACSKEFKTLTALQKHIRSVHNDEPAFQCSICYKTFNQKVHFQYHMNHHNNVRNYKCDVCEKAFIAKADLRTHLRGHTGERPYVCNVCGKDYLMMEHLKAHFLTHTEQSFACEICNKRFATHKTLRLHVRTLHEDEPRFKCTVCLKAFRRKHHLEYHLKKHDQVVKNLESSGAIINELDNFDDIVEETVDDPDFIF